MKVLFLIFLGISVSVTLRSQEINERDMTKLLHGSFDSLVAKFPQEEIINHLLNYRLSNTLNTNEIWYGNNNIDTNWLIKNFREDNCKVSLKIKSVYWLWLIYSDNKASLDMIPGIVKIGSDTPLFDYTRHFTGKKFIKITDDWVKELDDFLEIWGKLYKTLGLKYLQQRDISPLNPKYKFIFYPEFPTSIMGK